MDLKKLFAALVVTASMSGCMCATGNCGGDASIAESDLMRIEQAANRAEDAALRAEAAADKAEAIFHRTVQK